MSRSKLQFRKYWYTSGCTALFFFACNPIAPKLSRVDGNSPTPKKTLSQIPRELSYQSNLLSPLGRETLTLVVGKLRKIKLASQSFELERTGELNSLATRQNAILSKLRQIAPSCATITPQSQNFRCGWRLESLAKTTKALKKVSSQLLYRSRRIPYLLSRRIAVAEQLAIAIESPSAASTRSLCSVLEASDPLALPAILRLPKWQNELCHQGKLPFDMEIASKALETAVQELSIYSQLRRQLNVRGVLKFRYPRRSVPYQRLIVRLSASSKTQSAFKDALAKLVAKKPSARHAWFPGLSEGRGEVYEGHLLGLWGMLPAKFNEERVLQMMINVISAESEYRVSNGYGKILSLPKGNYEYTVYSISDRLDDPNYERKVDEGGLFWSNKRRFVTIAKQLHSG